MNPTTPECSVVPFQFHSLQDDIEARARRVEHADTDLLERRAIVACMLGTDEEIQHYMRLLDHRERSGIHLVLRATPETATR